MRRALFVVAVALHAALAAAQSAPADGAAAGPVVRRSGEQRFAASGSLPPGAEYHLVWEDPATHAVQALVRVPKGYHIPPHTHSRHETFLVLKGKLTLDFGTRAETLKAGDYALIPAGTAFSLSTGGWGGAEFLIAFDGPYDSKPADLPK
ncbi:MAG: cupin domain-containing protein [Elusimicrobiota bacterium]|nr:cupin domain-containing protein [Elusimicrobiota bacterium]